MALQRQTCANHPDRFGHALCMTCRKTVCQECATEWDGINYCVACLSKKRRATGESSTTLGWVLVAIACVLLFAAVLKVMPWATPLLIGS
jgi:hypothetical protein